MWKHLVPQLRLGLVVVRQPFVLNKKRPTANRFSPSIFLVMGIGSDMSGEMIV